MAGLSRGLTPFSSTAPDGRAAPRPALRHVRHIVVEAADLVEVPEGIDPAEAETVVVNGITAWQMLHGRARIRSGQTILVHGANGGVGSTLVQLAGHAGVRVIGTASPRHHDAVRALGATPLDYRAPDLPALVRALAPHGVDAVFDHIGGESIVRSFKLLAPGGTLVAYGTAATRDRPGSARLPVLKLIARLLTRDLLPNGRHTHFFDIRAGRRHPADLPRPPARRPDRGLRAPGRRRDHRAGGGPDPAEPSRRRDGARRIGNRHRQGRPRPRPQARGADRRLTHRTAVTVRSARAARRGHT
jgi:hypothetical protein